MPFTIPSIERVYGAQFIGGNRVELLWRGREAFERIFKAIRRAERLVCLEFYIFRNDETGLELAELLMEKARKGVTVNVLYDHLGSMGTPRKFWRTLREQGVNILASHSFDWTSPVGYFHRDHKKLIIVDGATALLGGLNIANEYRGLHLRLKEQWRDTGVEINGPASHALLETFRRAWLRWGGRGFDLPPPAGPVPGGLPVMAIFAHSSKGRRRMRRLLYYSVNHARKEICLTTAYFTPSRRMIETLEAATSKGVRVRLLVPGISDVPAAHYAGQSFFGRLLKAGVEIYAYQGKMLHAKSYIFDRSWSIVGSANLDFQSLRWNDEGNAGIADEGFARQMIEIFEDDLRRSVRIDMDSWRKRPISRKIKECFFSLFRRRL